MTGFTLASWERVALQPLDRWGEPGERLSLRGEQGTIATIVRWPGTLYRVFWDGGEIGDYPTEAEAVRAVEVKAGIIG
jgi:hypothetical protein